MEKCVCSYIGKQCIQKPFLIKYVKYCMFSLLISWRNTASNFLPIFTVFVIAVDPDLSVTWFQAGAAGKIAWALINGEEARGKSGKSAGTENTRKSSMLETDIEWSRANMNQQWYLTWQFLVVQVGLGVLLRPLKPGETPKAMEEETRITFGLTP